MFKFTFNAKYFMLFLLLFLVEVSIALWVQDRFIRPYLGDFLVVILLYTFVMSWVKANPYAVAIGVLFFAFAIEMAQYYDLITFLGWQHVRLAVVVLGSSFAVEDLVAYVLGVAFVMSLVFFTSTKE